MNAYESLIDYAHQNKVGVSEISFHGNLSGIYCDGFIFIDAKAQPIEKRCILAEELGHHYTGFGDMRFLPQSLVDYQEKIGRSWAFQKFLPLNVILKTRIKEKPSSFWELACALDVTEDFLKEALEYYQSKYGEILSLSKFNINLKTLEIYKK